MHSLGRHVLLILVVLSASLAFCGDTPVVSYAKSLKGQTFVLRAHEDLFGFPKISTFDQRLLYNTDVAQAHGKTVIGNQIDWQGAYFVSGHSYIVKSVSTHNDVIELKMWEVNGSRVPPEVKLNFSTTASLDDFKTALFTVFFSPTEDRDAYIRENNRKLVAKYFDSEPELLSLPDAQRMKLLEAIRMVSLSGRPKLERVGNALYVPAAVIGDTSVYNDVKVSKNQRIASSIEALLPDFKRISIAATDFPDAITGVKFEWNVYHRNFLADGQYSHGPDTKERMEMLVPRDSLKEFSNGNLSPSELVQKSILRENSLKVTLSSYDPIGAR